MTDNNEMDPHLKLALDLRRDALALAEGANLPKSAVAVAMMRAALMIFTDIEGHGTVSAWLQREAKAYAKAARKHAAH